MTDEYGRFRADLMIRIMSDKLTPAQVAKELGDMMERFTSIQYVEVRELLAMGETWKR